MTKPNVLFNITVHGHQPVGNLPEVMDESCDTCYGPFLELMDRHPRIRFSYHLSGCLLEWLQEHRPESLELLAAMVDRGQVELIGGAFYEPILTAIPRRDAVAQIALMREFTAAHFGVEARGLWLPERVWEPSIPSLLASAGVAFTLLDDTHFLAAGLKREELHGYFLAEDQGSLLPVFPMRERLRYTIPFEEPHATISVLRELAEEAPGTMVVYGDDVEKFGVWPDTFKHCYEAGWLARFLDALEESLPWIELVSLGEIVDKRQPRGLVCPPETSYAEMNEWTLPADLGAPYGRIRKLVREDPTLAPALPFVRGRSWRSFRMKYPEIRRLYGRSLHVSRRMAALPDDPAQAEAKRELFRGQCNCPYWHGIFGGHYLPHLREAVWSHLIEAERLADELTPLGASGEKTLLERYDIDLDGREEIYLRNEQLGIVIAPQGGRAIELDLRPWRLNLFSVLARRPEAYHHALAGLEEADLEAAKSIHDLRRAKDPDLLQALQYDAYEHLGFTDLVLREKPAPSDFLAGKVRDEYGLHAASWECLIEEGSRVRVKAPDTAPIRLSKTFRLDGPSVSAEYAVRNAGAGSWRGFLAVEVPVALQTGCSLNRVWRDRNGRTLGPLGLALEGREGYLAVSDWDHDLGIVLSSPGAQVLTYAIETVSQSESGFEGVHQHSVVVFLYDLTLKQGETRRWAVTVSASLAPVRSGVEIEV